MKTRLQIFISTNYYGYRFQMPSTTTTMAK